MSRVEDKLRVLGLELPDGSILPPSRPQLATAVQVGNVLFVSGHGPMKDGKFWPIGKLGRELDTASGYEASRLATLHALARLKQQLGDLDRIRRVIKVFGMVNCTPDFTEQPQVVNGASDLLVELFGEHGRHARSALGVASLPQGFAVEIEMILEVA